MKASSDARFAFRSALFATPVIYETPRRSRVSVRNFPDIYDLAHYRPGVIIIIDASLICRFNYGFASREIIFPADVFRAIYQSRRAAYRDTVEFLRN